MNGLKIFLGAAVFFSLNSFAHVTEQENENALAFWEEFKEFDLNEMSRRYENDVLEMSYSLLLSPIIGATEDRERPHLLGRQETLDRFHQMGSRLAPLSAFSDLYDSVYEVYFVDYAKNVENIDVGLYHELYPAEGDGLWIMRLRQKVVYAQQIRMIKDKDYVLVAHRKDKKFKHHTMMFVFDKETGKVKAQQLKMGVLDAIFFPENPYSI